MAMSAPSRMLAASAASAPVNGRLMPISIDDGTDWATAICAAAGDRLETRAALATSDGPSRRTSTCIVILLGSYSPTRWNFVARIVERGPGAVNVCDGRGR